MRKEVRVGFGDGLLLGILSFIVLGIFIMIVKGRPAGFAFAVSGCIGLALMCSMVISSLTGTLVPMFFNKIGIDPAVASGPLITTINDLIAVIVYYGLSWLFLLEMMHL
ncbi:MAG: magnesium transporter [Lachnospiraceae bacterium]